MREISTLVFCLVFAAFATPDPASAQSSSPCANPDREAVVTHLEAPVYPESARKLNLAPVIDVIVEITVDPDGKVVAAKIIKSSNNADMDEAAITSARMSQFAPRVVNCRPTSGNYAFVVHFDKSTTSPKASPTPRARR